MKYLFFFFLIFFFSPHSKAEECELEKPISTYTPRFAKLFEISYYKKFKIIRSGSDRFLLMRTPSLDCKTSLPVFSNQIKRFVATSTTHLPFLSMFGLEKTLIGFQGVRYIYNEKLRKQKIENINVQLNPEELLALAPDLVMAYPANLNSRKKLNDFQKLKIPMVFNLDYEEVHPLARAEWMIFSASFFSKDKEAQDFFKKIADSYFKIAKEIQKMPKKKILVGDIQNGKWATCGGKSDLATLIEDAGGELLIKNSKAETQFLSLEKIFSLTELPSLWLSQNIWNDLKIPANDSRYKKFKNIPTYNNNRRLNKEGFNDYWEGGMGRPDLLLLDLKNIFANNKTELNWYQELK